MTAEAIICMVIVAISSMPMIILGIFQYKSKEPVGFWSGKEPPKSEQITDVKAYNQKHGRMWMLYGGGLFVCFIGVGFWEKAALFFVALGMIECIGGIFVMIAYHKRLDNLYLKEENK